MLRAITAAILGALLLAAQSNPFVPLDGAVNGANDWPACAPFGGIAPGSIFSILGRDLGPATPVKSESYPLQTSLDGASVRVTMHGTSYQAWPIESGRERIRAILPSAVPPGEGTLQVTYQGRSSEAVPILVKSVAPGIFTEDPRGNGQAVVWNVDGQTGAIAVNSRERPLRPGQLASIWATGLGAADSSEATGPIPGHRADLDVRVWIADRPANVIYQGRSGCCPGADQVIFETPEGVEGCQVPLNIEVNGAASNFGSIAIGANGTCRAVVRPAPPRVDRFGLIFFLDGFGSVLLPGALEDYVRMAFFTRGRVEGDVEAPLYAFESNAEAPVDSCTIRYGTSFPDPSTQPGQTALDPGAGVRVTGPGGEFVLAPAQGVGAYQDPRRVLLPPGRYAISNGAGGRDVGPFSIEAETIALQLTSRPDKIVRADGLTVTWDYTGPDQLLTIFGSTASCGRGIYSFTCVTRAANRRFTVPARILKMLPPSTSFFGVSNGALNINATSPGGLRRFQAPGLDLGLFMQLSISAIRPNYE